MLWEKGTSANNNEVVMESSSCTPKKLFSWRNFSNKAFSYSKMYSSNILRDTYLGELLKFPIRTVDI